MKSWTYLFLVVVCCSCATGRIPPEEYSPQATPVETYEFAKKAVARDDPEAFYACLAGYVRESISLSNLKLGWSLAGKYFYIFLKSKVKKVETPAPDLKYRFPYSSSKITISSGDLEASFLLLKEKQQWKLANPTHYNLPDISKLKEQGRLPWRIGQKCLLSQYA